MKQTIKEILREGIIKEKTQKPGPELGKVINSMEIEKFKQLI